MGSEGGIKEGSRGREGGERRGREREKKGESEKEKGKEKEKNILKEKRIARSSLADIISYPYMKRFTAHFN